MVMVICQYNYDLYDIVIHIIRTSSPRPLLPQDQKILLKISLEGAVSPFYRTQVSLVRSMDPSVSN